MKKVFMVLLTTMALIFAINVVAFAMGVSDVSAYFDEEFCMQMRKNYNFSLISRQKFYVSKDTKIKCTITIEGGELEDYRSAIFWADYVGGEDYIIIPRVSGRNEPYVGEFIASAGFYDFRVTMNPIRSKRVVDMWLYADDEPFYHWKGEIPRSMTVLCNTYEEWVLPNDAPIGASSAQITTSTIKVIGDIDDGYWELRPDNVWTYNRSDGSKLTDCWAWIKGKCYCFDKDAKLYIATTTPDGYTVNENGEWTVNGLSQTK